MEPKSVQTGLQDKETLSLASGNTCLEMLFHLFLIHEEETGKHKEVRVDICQIVLFYPREEDRVRLGNNYMIGASF